MKLTIRLYWCHDQDLIYLAHNEEFSMCVAVKNCLEAYADGKAYKLAFPRGKLELFKIHRNSYSYVINLNEEKEQNIINLLKNVKDRHRNGFIKNLIRGYLEAPYTFAYLLDKQYVLAGNKAFEQLVSWESIVTPPKKRKREKKNIASGDIVTKLPAETPHKQKTKKKKNAIEALGSILLNPKEDDSSLIPNTDGAADKPAAAKSGSVMFPVPEAKHKSEPAFETVKKTDDDSDDNAGSGFDLDNALSSIMQEY